MRTSTAVLVILIGLLSASHAGGQGSPPPPGYNMGTIVNGDFEAGGAGWTWLNAWLESWEGNKCVWFNWSLEYGPEGPMETMAQLRQSFVMPTNASFLTFMHWGSGAEELPSNAYVYIYTVGFSAYYHAPLMPAAWTQTSIALPAGMRGHNATVEFWTNSGGQGQEGSGGWCLDYVGFDAPGTTAINPVMPTVVAANIFQFTEVPRNTWVDPATAWGFVYKMTGQSLFTKISDFPTGFGPLQVTADGQILGSACGPGDLVDFLALLGHGVSEFTVTNINPLVDPADPMCFPLKLDFNTATASFNMTALPEPATLALVAAGALGLVRRRR